MIFITFCTYFITKSRLRCCAAYMTSASETHKQTSSRTGRGRPHSGWPQSSAAFTRWRLLCMLSCSVMSDSLWAFVLQAARLLCPRDFSGRNTGVGCHFLLQGSSQLRGRTCVSCLQADSAPAKATTHTRKRKCYWDRQSWMEAFRPKTRKPGQKRMCSDCSAQIPEQYWFHIYIYI